MLPQRAHRTTSPEPGHVQCPWSDAIPRMLLRRCRTARFGLPVAIVVLVTPLTVLSVGHGWSRRLGQSDPTATPIIAAGLDPAAVQRLDADMTTPRRRVALPGLLRLGLFTAFGLLAWTPAGAQTPAPPPVAQPPAGQQPPATAPKPAPRKTPAAAATRTSTATVSVTDPSGQGLQGVTITVTGPVPRSGKTARERSVHFAGLKAGDYRIRFEHDGFFTLERDVTIKAGLPIEVDASLTRHPRPPRPLRLLHRPRRRTRHRRRSGESASRGLHRTEPGQRGRVGLHRERADDVAAAEGTAARAIACRRRRSALRRGGRGHPAIGGQGPPLKSTYIIVVSRGTTRAVTRKGRNPMYLLSIVSGAPCTK